MSRFRHRMRQERTKSPPPNPQHKFPSNMLEVSFQSFAERAFPSAVKGSPQYRCLERSWYFGVLFFQGVVNSAAELPSAVVIEMLHGIEKQLTDYIAALATPQNQESNDATQPATDDKRDSGEDRQQTESSGEQDPQQQDNC